MLRIVINSTVSNTQKINCTKYFKKPILFCDINMQVWIRSLTNLAFLTTFTWNWRLLHFLKKFPFSLIFCLQAAVPRDASPTMKYYEVLAIVYNIKDEKTAGNLVACINVGETYHQRKEKVTCTQWYLFNDFSILPIEKVSVPLLWQPVCWHGNNPLVVMTKLEIGISELFSCKS